LPLCKKNTTRDHGGNPVSKATLKLRLLKRLKCTLKYEKLAWTAGAKLVAGVDEVGRGSLFGPVVAAAVVSTRAIACADCAIPSCWIARRARSWRHAFASTRWPGQSRRSMSPPSIRSTFTGPQSAPWKKRSQVDRAARSSADRRAAAELRCRQTPIIHGDALSARLPRPRSSQGRTRCHDQRLGPGLPRIPACIQQRLQHSAPFEDAARERPYPLHRLSFAPVWTSSAPQEVLEFMLEEKQESETDVSSACKS